MEEKSDFIKVGIRIKPSHNGTSNSEVLKIYNDEDIPVLFVGDRKQWYIFDNIFSQETTQEEVYLQSVQPLVKNVLCGYNSTVIAYGQCGSGKSYTIGSNPDRNYNSGFISKTLDEFFSNQEEQKEIDIAISFYEIYNEMVYDLLSKKSAEPLTDIGVRSEGIVEESISSSHEGYSLLKLGCRNRQDEDANNNSNDSHVIFTIHCIVKHENRVTSAKFNLVDLASSDKFKKAKNEAMVLKEPISINKGLLALGRVMHALSAKQAHIPYHSSLITSVLKDSLSTTSFITLVACVSANIQDIRETIRTLEFAQISSNIKARLGMKAITPSPESENCVLSHRAGNDTPSKRLATPLKRNTLSPTSNIRNTIMQKCHNSYYNNLVIKERLLGDNVHSVFSNVEVMDPTVPIIEQHTLSMEMIVSQKIHYMMRSLRTKKLFIKNRIEAIDQRQRNISTAHKVNKIKTGSLQQRKTPIALDKNKRGKSEPIISLTRQNANNVEPIPSTSKIGATIEQNEDTPSTKVTYLRRSERIAAKQASKTVTNTVSSGSIASEKRRGKRSSKSSTSNTEHNKYVLQLLNTGTIKELQKLSSIGVKTATQIFTFRNLNGQFDTFDDLGKMPSWRGQAFERFLKENFLSRK